LAGIRGKSGNCVGQRAGEELGGVETGCVADIRCNGNARDVGGVEDSVFGAGKV